MREIRLIVVGAVEEGLLRKADRTAKEKKMKKKTK
jgi:hypothetical protein